ncbi:hypothetical protein FQZ97_1029570 [compost metagenome]
MQVGGNLRALRCPDAACALGFKVPPELQAPRKQHQCHPAKDRHGGQQRQPGLFPGAGAGHHHQDARHYQGQPGGKPGPAAGLVCLGLVE